MMPTGLRATANTLEWKQWVLAALRKHILQGTKEMVGSLEKAVMSRKNMSGIFYSILYADGMTQ